jgi:hypothetical protein
MNAPTTDPLRWLTTADVADFCQMSKRWVEQQRKAGRITPIPGLGRAVRYTRADVEELQASLQKTTQPEPVQLAQVIEIRPAA